MMIRSYGIFSWLIYVVVWQAYAYASIDVREAQQDDLEAVMDLDRRVSFEYFEPMYKNFYAHYGFGQNAHDFLELELVSDRESFSESIKNREDFRLYVAYDMSINKLVGLVYFHRKDDGQSIELDLLLTDEAYRGKGIGKKLVSVVCKVFTGIKICDVYPFKFGNKATLTFYEKIGFINMGDGPTDRINCYGVCYADLYFHYRLIL